RLLAAYTSQNWGLTLKSSPTRADERRGDLLAWRVRPRAHWFCVVNYLTYAFTPRLSGTTRLELFDDEQGQRTGFAGLYTALTAGLSFRPHKDVIFRPEVRYDYNEEPR